MKTKLTLEFDSIKEVKDLCIVLTSAAWSVYRDQSIPTSVKEVGMETIRNFTRRLEEFE
jgi:hypothetical protein